MPQPGRVAWRRRGAGAPRARRSHDAAALADVSAPVQAVPANAQPDFDERRYGSIADLMRACQKDGLLRLERDRQGAPARVRERRRAARVGAARLGRRHIARTDRTREAPSRETTAGRRGRAGSRSPPPSSTRRSRKSSKKRRAPKAEARARGKKAAPAKRRRPRAQESREHRRHLRHAGPRHLIISRSGIELHSQRHHRPRRARAGPQAPRHVHRRRRQHRPASPGLGNARQLDRRGDERPRLEHPRHAAQGRLVDHHRRRRPRHSRWTCIRRRRRARSK